MPIWDQPKKRSPLQNDKKIKENKKGLHSSKKEITCERRRRTLEGIATMKGFKGDTYWGQEINQKGKEKKDLKKNMLSRYLPHYSLTT